MNNNEENSIDIKNRLANFYSSNRRKIYFFFLALIIIIISFTFIKHKNEKKNIIISEKYISAGLYQAEKKKDNATKLYNEIILSKNNFYAILALNAIIENNLILDTNKVLNYFKLLEETNISKEQKDLLIFKKALFLIKASYPQEGNKLLKKLIDDKSNLETLAKETISE